MTLMALDPGPTQSAYVIWNGERPISCGICENEEILNVMVEFAAWTTLAPLAIEMIACYGMAVGSETFETCVWIGRFMQKWTEVCHKETKPTVRIPRLDVKMHLCHSPQAKDANVRQALIDRIAAQHGLSAKDVIGKKKTEGPLYEVVSHIWAALAVAVTVRDRVWGTAA